MGMNQSIYEQPGTLDYYRFSAEEYALVKKVWSGIEINPQFHGNAWLMSFCETYPQYVKFFTLERSLVVNFDARIMAKFSMIMETMGYLLLDFNNRLKRLDRFVGYIAMVHKDMRLDEQDMRNLVTSLLEYLSQTYPAQMTSQCREAMSRFMDKIVKQLSIKMEAFRRYDDAQSDSTTRSKLSWGQCPFFGEPVIFGKTKLYWDEWKKQWDKQLNKWTVQASFSNIEESPVVFPNEKDTRIKFVDENSMLEQQASVQKRQRISDVSASKLALNLSKTSAVKRSQNRVRKDIPLNRARDKHVARRTDDQFHRSLCEHPEATSASRKKRRAKKFADALKLQADVPMPRRHLRSRLASVDLSALVKTILMADDEKTTKRFESPKNAKPCNTARERRREHLKINLE